MPDSLPLSLESVIAHACGDIGLDGHEVQPLHVHSNAVFLLPALPAVARVGGGAEAAERADRAVRVARWLGELGFPAVAPLPVKQPVVVNEVPVTFWQYVAVEPGKLAGAEVLGRLLRELHAIAVEPPPVPPVRPMVRLLAAVDASPVLGHDEREWFAQRANELLDRYAQLDFPLGPPGLIHGDAQVSNILVAKDGRVLLGDWDAAATGPREWDLVATAAGDRFGMPAEERAAFGAAYGYQVTSWPGWTVLRDLHELHAVAAHIRRAPESGPHATEMRWRIASLRAGDRRPWHAVG